MMALFIIWGIFSVAIAGVFLANVRIRVSKRVIIKPVKKKVITHKRIDIKV